ncbi:MAG: hypothetical protein U9R14_04285 [Patescibacteria group bacterium]|nr:hypothetical protein [Patescibacteria group bacterium]
MNDAKINLSIINFIKDYLSPKSEEKELIKKRYDEISRVLKGINFQSGSYARFTAITPVNDLDVIWELPVELLRQYFPEIFSVKKVIYPSHLNIQEIINDLASKLKDEYKGKARIKPQSHSVGIYFGVSDDEFSIDIVPAIPLQQKNEFGDPVYLIPEIGKLSKTKRIKRYGDESSKISWIKSDPRGYIKAAQKINEQNDNFRKSTKFVKTWKFNCKKQDDDFKLKSFHIEQIIYDICIENSNYDCFDTIVNFYVQLTARISGASIPDRADNFTKIDEYINDLTEVQKNKIKSKISEALSSIDKIKNDTDEKNLVLLIQNLLLIDETKKETVKIPNEQKPYSRPYYKI